MRSYFNPIPLERDIEAAFIEACAEIEAETVALAPSKTGATRRAIKVRIQAPLRAVLGLFGPDAQRAKYANMGARAHKIRARHARALSFPGLSEPVEEVDHPGARGSHFLERGGASFIRHFRAALKRRGR